MFAALFFGLDFYLALMTEYGFVLSAIVSICLIAASFLVWRDVKKFEHEGIDSIQKQLLKMNADISGELRQVKIRLSDVEEKNSGGF